MSASKPTSLKQPSHQPTSHKLPTLAKFTIVKALAHNYMPMEVVALIQSEFGITISRQTVEHYDPRKSAQIAKCWESYFLQELRAYNQALDNIATESRAWRQKQRCKLLEISEKRGDAALSLRIIDSAMKEATGGFLVRTSRSKRVKYNPALDHKSVGHQWATR
jgi:hypothetical protein